MSAFSHGALPHTRLERDTGGQDNKIDSRCKRSCRGRYPNVRERNLPDAGSQFAGKQMLAQKAPAVQPFFPLCLFLCVEGANPMPTSSGDDTPMEGMQNFPAPSASPYPAEPKGSCSAVKCSHNLCPPYNLPSRTILFTLSQQGGMGACPHVHPRPFSFLLAP